MLGRLRFWLNYGRYDWYPVQWPEAKCDLRLHAWLPYDSPQENLEMEVCAHCPQQRMRPAALLSADSQEQG